MNELTKIGLMDDCIDGDREKFDQLFGAMYDQFSCFFSLLRENGITKLPENQGKRRWVCLTAKYP